MDGAGGGVAVHRMVISNAGNVGLIALTTGNGSISIIADCLRIILSVHIGKHPVTDY